MSPLSRYLITDARQHINLQSNSVTHSMNSKYLSYFSLCVFPFSKIVVYASGGRSALHKIAV